MLPTFSDLVNCGNVWCAYINFFAVLQAV